MWKHAVLEGALDERFVKGGGRGERKKYKIWMFNNYFFPKESLTNIYVPDSGLDGRTSIFCIYSCSVRICHLLSREGGGSKKRRNDMAQLIWQQLPFYGRRDLLILFTIVLSFFSSFYLMSSLKKISLPHTLYESKQECLCNICFGNSIPETKKNETSRYEKELWR